MERDTMPAIIDKVKRTAYQVRRLAGRLLGSSLQETLRNDSELILKHIAYAKDAANHEQLRSPRRLLYEGKGDCDCFAVTLGALLLNQGIDFRFRITQYPSSRGQWSHIYVVVPVNQSSPRFLVRSDYVVLDPVTNEHDKEVPFTKKRDYNMSLQFLDGFNRVGSLGACPQSQVAQATAPAGTQPGAAPAPAASSKPAVVDYATRDGLAAVGMSLTSDILSKAGIPFKQGFAADNTPQVIASTPQGELALPTVLDGPSVDQLKTQLSQMAKTAVNAAKSPTGMVVAGTVLLSLAAWAFWPTRRNHLAGASMEKGARIDVLPI